MAFLTSLPGATLTLAILLAVAVVVSNVKKVNMGLVCLMFAWLWGTFILGYKPADVLSQFPTQTFLRLMAIIMMYGYGVRNGTIPLLARKILYPFRNHAWAVPLVCIVIAAVLGMTIGNSAMAAFVPLLFMSIAVEGGWRPVFFSFISSMCGPVFSSIPFSQCGSIIQGILEGTEYAAEAGLYTMHVYLNAVPCFLLFLIVVYFVIGAYKVKTVNMEKPEAYTPIQRKTLIMYIIVCLIIASTSMASIFIPETWLGRNGGKFHLIFLAVTGCVLCPLLGLGKQTEALQTGRWHIYLMISGIGTLVNVASKYGCVTWLGTVIADVFPSFLIIPVLAIICSAMCCFMSFQAVLPVVFPLIPVMATLTGIDPTRMMSTLFIFCIIATYSPYSAAGMMANAQCPREELREPMLKDQFKLVGAGVVFFMVCYFVGLTGLFQV